MSETHTTTILEPATTDSGKASDLSTFTTIVQATFDETARSSGSLESNASSSGSSSSTGTSGSSVSQSVPSLLTSSTTLTSISVSPSSSKVPSPCPSILRSNSAPPQSFPTTSSGSSSPNVTFAPLPQTEPRKRNSSHPLGVAARSRLLKHRRMLRERGINPDHYAPGNGIGPDDDFGVEFPEAEDMPEGTEEGERPRRSRTASETGENDPLVALGKALKGAGKTLWKSLSMREMRAKEREAAEKAGEAAGAESQAGVNTEQPQKEQKKSGSLKKKRSAPRRARMGTGHLFDDQDDHQGSGEGGVWEEEISEDSLKKLLSNPPPVPDTANGNENDQDAVPVAPLAGRTSTVTTDPSTAKVR